MLEIKVAQEEAVDNEKWLRPLRKYLEAFMEPPEYPARPETFKARTSALNAGQLLPLLYRQKVMLSLTCLNPQCATTDTGCNVVPWL